jgi:predicted aldo/keto reductase-like oxidoreductase
MQYRHFGGMEWQPSALGFGCMRLPTAENKKIDELKAGAMVRLAIDEGVNYIDTGYGYHEGQSEAFLGRTLQNGYRDKVMLATKLPVWHVHKPEDFEIILYNQLDRLQTDHIDFYLFHSLDGESWQNVVLRYNLLARAEKALHEGKIRHIGFSFHDGYKEFEEIIDGYERWELCQIQYNYMDVNKQAGLRGLQKAAARGLGVVIMEPLLGGRLATPPPDVAALFAAGGRQWTPAEWALQWLWNQPEISLVLSGMNTMEQVVENLISAGRSRIGQLNAAEQALISQVREKYENRAETPCTSCGYCMPCPNGVDIPENFRIYNEVTMYDKMNSARFKYSHFLAESARSNQCIQCRICEEKCPQGILISEWMPKVHKALG